MVSLFGLCFVIFLQLIRVQCWISPTTQLNCSDGTASESKCLEDGWTKCPNGKHCGKGSFNFRYYCSADNRCFYDDWVYCENLRDDCVSGKSCGRIKCIPNGASECHNGNYCENGFYCNKDNKCIESDAIYCKSLNKTCGRGESCGKTRCIPVGAMECPDGRYCEQGKYCGKFHTDKCYNVGTFECKDFSHRSCGSGFYCGKRDCVPVGYVECLDGSTCGPDYYCSNSWPAKCIPRLHAECAGANSNGYCGIDYDCIREVCVPKGRQLCADNKHHCDRQQQVCDMTFSLINSTNYTRGCLPKDVSICDGYKELDQKVPCGEDGYLLKHGYSYCRKFFAYFNTLSEEEQKVLECIIRCLLRKIRRFLSVVESNSSEQVDCAQIAPMAAQHQMPCYRKCKLCSVRPHNSHPIWRFIETELTPEENREHVAQMCRNRQIEHNADSQEVDDD